jgi:hypothetical protein
LFTLFSDIKSQMEKLRQHAKSLQASRVAELRQAQEAKEREIQRLKAQAIEQTRAAPYPELSDPKPRRFKQKFSKIKPPVIMDNGPTITSDDRTVLDPSITGISDLVAEIPPSHTQSMNDQPPIEEPVPIPQVGPCSPQALQPDSDESQGVISSQTPTSPEPPASGANSDRPDNLKEVEMGEIPTTEAVQPSSSFSRTDLAAPSTPPEPIQVVVKRKRGTKALKPNAEAQAIRRNPRRVVTQNPTRLELQIQQRRKDADSLQASRRAQATAAKERKQREEQEIAAKLIADKYKAAPPQSASQDSRIPSFKKKASAPTADAPIEKNAGTPRGNIPMSPDLGLAEVTGRLSLNDATAQVQHRMEEPSTSSLCCPAIQLFSPTPQDAAHTTVQADALTLAQPPLPITEGAELEEGEIRGEHALQAPIEFMGPRTSLAGGPAQINASMVMDLSSQMTIPVVYPGLQMGGSAPAFGTNGPPFWDQHPTVEGGRHALEPYNMQNNPLGHASSSGFVEPYRFTNLGPIPDGNPDLLQMAVFAPGFVVNNNIEPPMFGNQHPIVEGEAKHVHQAYDMQNNSHGFGSLSNFDELQQLTNSDPHWRSQYEYQLGSLNGLNNSGLVRASGGILTQETPVVPYLPESSSLTSPPTLDNNQITTPPLVPDSLPDPPTRKNPLPKPPIWAQVSFSVITFTFC